MFIKDLARLATKRVFFRFASMVILGLGLPFLFGSTAHAQSNSTTPRRWGIEVGAYTGTNQTAPANLNLKQPSVGTNATIENVHWRAQPFSGSAYYGLRVIGWTPKAPRLGIFFDFNHHKAYARTNDKRRIVGTFYGEPVDTVAPIRDRVQRFQITNGINLATLGLLYRGVVQTSPSFPEGRFQPYAGGGPSYMVLVPINTVNNEENHKKREWDGLAFSLMGGFRYGLTSRISLTLEARYDRVNANVNIAHGQGETNLNTIHESGGLLYRF